MIRSLYLAALVVATSTLSCLPSVLPEEWDLDHDGDPNKSDCAPEDPAVHHAAVEICGDEIDNNCDQMVDLADAECADPDGDGVIGANDCDDNDPDVHLFHPEICDGKDNDCDEVIPEDEVDVDGDGQMVCDEDCDDENAEVSPVAFEVCDDGVDNDCNGSDFPCGEIPEVVDLGNADGKWSGATEGGGLGDAVAPFWSSSEDPISGFLFGAELDRSVVDDGGAVYLVGRAAGGHTEVTVLDPWWHGEVHDHAGKSISAGGDVNGDGHTDLLVGAPSGPTIEFGMAGRAYLLLGPLVSSGSIQEEATTVIEGLEVLDRTGASVAVAGDLDLDGHDDLLVGANGSDLGGSESSGAVFLVYGAADLTGTIFADEADATFLGEGMLHYVGSAVSGAGDVDGDGHDDVLIGGPEAFDAGAAYLWLCGGTPPSGDLSLANADAVVLGGTAGDHLGFSVAPAGDLDGDGLDDVLVGASGADDGAGAVYVLYGPLTGTLGPADARFVLLGRAGDGAGAAVAGRGDVDGDGLIDILVGATGALDTGAAYLVSGSQFDGADILLQDSRVELRGENIGDNTGFSVALVPDLQGDGCDELVVGADGFDDGRGAAYLVYGGGESCTAPGGS